MRIRGFRILVALAVLALAGAAEAGETVKHRYDALGRLTGTSTTGTVNNGAASNLTYDPAGNRRTYTVAGSANAAPPPGGPAPLGAQPEAIAGPAAPGPSAADAAGCGDSDGDDTTAPAPADPADPAEGAPSTEPCL